MKAYLRIIFSMLIWGSLPIFVKGVVSLSSAEIVLCRAAIAAISLFAVSLLIKKNSDKAVLKKNLLRLILTGVSTGLNWMLLFESYRYVDSGVSTLMYYLAPVIVVVGSVFLFKEKLSLARIASIILAVIGMVVISGAKLNGTSPVKGIIFGLMSAFFYSLVTLSNKRIKGLDGLTITLFELIGAFASILPYVLFSHEGGFPQISGKEIVFLIILGTVHSGLALFLYFSSLQELPAQTAALLSYIDPVSSIFFVTLILKEALTLPKICGAVLIIGGAVIGEIFHKKKRDV